MAHGYGSAEEMKAAAQIQEGDLVMGQTKEGMVHGMVEHIMWEGGTLGTPGSEYALESMPPENPAMSVRIYKQEDPGQWEPTAYSIGMMYQDAEKLDTLDGHVMEEDEDMYDDMEMMKADSYIPTSGMKSAARRALEWKKEGRRGGTRVGLTRANQIVNGENLSESTVMRMFSFFSRHEVNKQATGFNSGEEGFPSPGRVAWDLWGGDAGFSWSRKKSEQIKRNRMKKSTWGGAFSPVGPSARMEVNVDDYLLDDEVDAPLDEIEVGINSTAAIEGETVDTTPEGGMHEPQEQVEPEMQDTNEMNAAEDRGGIADPTL